MWPQGLAWFQAGLLQEAFKSRVGAPPLLTSRMCSSLFSRSSCRAVDSRPGGEMVGGRPEFLGLLEPLYWAQVQGLHANPRSEFFWSLDNKNIRGNGTLEKEKGR